MIKENTVNSLPLLICFLMFFTSSMMVIQYHSITAFLMLQVVFLVWMAIQTKKLYKMEYNSINLIFGLMLVSAVFAGISNLPISYKKSAIYMAIMLVPTYFTVSYIFSAAKKNIVILKVIKSAIRYGCLFQLLWAVLQYFFYYQLGIDINKTLFVDLFHFVDNATSFKQGISFVPSGLFWHPANLAPIVVIVYCLFDNIFIKALALFVAIICKNTTAFIGIALCILIDSLYHLYLTLKNGITRKKLMLGILCFAIGIILIISTNLYVVIWNNIFTIYQRAFGIVNDGGSALAHKRYYTAYFNVLAISNPFQMLFGYGEGCSGYPFGILFSQYTNLGSWSVESDVMNILIGRGLIGFIAYYFFLMQILIKGLKINYKYALCMFAIIFEGITYNIQFTWVFIFELILYFTSKNNLDFFKMEKHSEGGKYLWFQSLFRHTIEKI